MYPPRIVVDTGRGKEPREGPEGAVLFFRGSRRDLVRAGRGGTARPRALVSGKAQALEGELARGGLPPATVPAGAHHGDPRDGPRQH